MSGSSASAPLGLKVSSSVAPHLSQWARQRNEAKTGQHVYYFDSIDSTNTYLKNSVQTRAICLATEQTAGRGRGSHRWLAQAGSALLGSWSYRLDGPPSPQMTMRVGLAVLQAIESSLSQSEAQTEAQSEAQLESPLGTRPEGLQASNPTLCLKAPNDIHCVWKTGEVKKLAGLLVEVISHTKKEVSLVIGLGLNLTAYPAHTEPFAATSLAELNVPVTQNLVFALLDGLTAGFDQLGLHLHLQTEPLTESERATLLRRLKPHPLYKNLLEVSPAGDLIHTDRTIAWIEL